MYTLTNLDALAWMRTLPDSSVDLIITDVPYESLEKWRKVGTTTRLKKSKSSSNKWFEIFPNSLFPEFFEEAYRVMKKNSHLYFFCDFDTMFVARPIGENAGFKCWKSIIWDKCLHGDTPILSNKGTIPLKELTTQHTVLTPKGKWVGVKGIRSVDADTTQLRLSTGELLVLSSDHLLVGDNEKLKSAAHFKKGERLKSLDLTPSLGVTCLTLNALMPGELCDDFNVKSIELTSDLGFLLGTSLTYGLRMREPETDIRASKVCPQQTQLIRGNLISEFIKYFTAMSEGKRYFKPIFYEMCSAFKQGVLEGLVGIGITTYTTPSQDFAYFVLRGIKEQGTQATISVTPDGTWCVKIYKQVDAGLCIVETSSGETAQLIDISIDDPEQLFVLGNGGVSHNCAMSTGYHYRNSHEKILFFEKGKRALNSKSIRDVIADKRIWRGYPTEKPLGIMEILVSQSTKVGDHVIDPFMGSAPVGLAALNYGCTFAGNDLDIDAVTLAESRLSKRVETKRE